VEPLVQEMKVPFSKSNFHVIERPDIEIVVGDSWVRLGHSEDGGVKAGCGRADCNLI